MIDVKLSNQCAHAGRPEYRKERRREYKDKPIDKRKIEICLNCPKEKNKCRCGECKLLKEEKK